MTTDDTRARWLEIGTLVREGRQQREVSRAQLAAELEVDVSCISEIEDGLGNQDSFTCLTVGNTREVVTIDLRDVTHMTLLWLRSTRWGPRPTTVENIDRLRDVVTAHMRQQAQPESAAPSVAEDTAAMGTEPPPASADSRLGTEPVSAPPSSAEPAAPATENVAAEAALDVADTGWPLVAATLRNARLRAGRSLAEQVELDGEIAQRAEDGLGHASYADVLAAHAYAVRRLEHGELQELTESFMALMQPHLNSGTSRLASSSKRPHFPGWLTSEWPRAGVLIATAMDLQGVTSSDLASRHGLPVAVVEYIREGGGYDPRHRSWDPVTGRHTDLDLRQVTGDIVGSKPANGDETSGVFTVPLAKLLTEPLGDLVHDERRREWHTYLAQLEASQPRAGADWLRLALRVYRQRHAENATVQTFSSAYQVPTQLVRQTEAAEEPDTHRGYYRLHNMLNVIDPDHSDTQTWEMLARHKVELDNGYLSELASQSEPFSGWAEAGFPELGLALHDSRTSSGETTARVARSIGRPEAWLIDAERGFAGTKSVKGAELRALIDRLGWSDTERERHRAALDAVGAYAATPPPAPGTATADPTGSHRTAGDDAVVGLLRQAGGSRSRSIVRRQPNADEFADALRQPLPTVTDDPHGWRTYGWLHRLNRTAHGFTTADIARVIRCPEEVVIAMERGERVGSSDLDSVVARSAELAFTVRLFQDTKYFDPSSDFSVGRGGWFHSARIATGLRREMMFGAKDFAERHGLDVELGNAVEATKPKIAGREQGIIAIARALGTELHGRLNVTATPSAPVPTTQNEQRLPELRPVADREPSVDTPKVGGERAENSPPEPSPREIAAANLAETDRAITESGATAELQQWKRVGALLAGTRRLRGLSTSELAKELRTHNYCIDEIEAGLGYVDGFMYYPSPESRKPVAIDLRVISGKALSWVHNPAEGSSPAADEHIRQLRDFVATQIPADAGVASASTSAAKAATARRTRKSVSAPPQPRTVLAAPPPTPTPYTSPGAGEDFQTRLENTMLRRGQRSAVEAGWVAFAATLRRQRTDSGNMPAETGGPAAETEAVALR
ncbi:MAG: hypothetical protein DLM55_10965, partial [Acidimicrobiales bacterium]